MAQQLPQVFLEVMRQLFEEYSMREEWPAFVASFAENPARAYRFNALKVLNSESFKQLHTHLLEEQGVALSTDAVPWAGDGLYLPSNFQAGKTIAYRAGLFYIQEASAMLPALALGTQPGEAVLDLCAAPGGKSARIAADLQGRGLLWSNDINAQRAKVLLRNLEQLGVSNSIVSVAEPAAMAVAMPAVFDRILIDAPCSGEGMFRRDPQAVHSWSTYSNEHLLDIQAGLLRSASRLLKAGGSIVYSTCTFNRAENEEQIEHFLAEHPNFVSQDIRPFLMDSSMLSPGLFSEQALRVWPHRARGDGHFVCLLKQAAEGANQAQSGPARNQPLDKSNNKALGKVRLAFLDCAQMFLSQTSYATLSALPLWRWRLENGRLHLLPEIKLALNLAAVRFLKTGTYLAEIKENVKGMLVKPSHSFLISLKAGNLAYALNLCAGDLRVRQYLRGETLFVEAEESARWPKVKGELWVPVLWEKHVLGWGKFQGNTMKNLYPSGWRTM